MVTGGFALLVELVDGFVYELVAYSSSSTSVPRRECDGWKLMCARLYWICFWIFKMFSFMRKDSSYVALQAED
jgi:hypothetical protein